MSQKSRVKNVEQLAVDRFQAVFIVAFTFHLSPFTFHLSPCRQAIELREGDRRQIHIGGGQGSASGLQAWSDREW